MKVCLASLAPFLGGAEVALERLALGLKNLDIEVVCVLGFKNEVADRYEQARLRWIHLPMPFTDKMKWPQFLLAKYNFRKFLEKEKVDILHCNDLPSFQLPGAAAKPLGIPRICHHRYIFDGEAIKWFLKFGVEYHIFVSCALRRELENAYSPLKSDLGEVVYDGLPMPELPDENLRAKIKKILRLPPDKEIVLFAGQIIPRKGVQDLIRAWSLLSNKIKEKAHLVIIGDDLAGKGAYRIKIENLARELKVEADFRGFQKNVDQWLDAADIVTVPSHIEPLGNATLEAMAHAKPIIGTTVGGIPEMVVHGKTGLLIPPKSPKDLVAALESLLVNPELREGMGKAARQRCEERFSIQTHVQEVVKQYQTVLQA